MRSERPTRGGRGPAAYEPASELPSNRCSAIHRVAEGTIKMRVAPSCLFDDDPRALRHLIAERTSFEEVRFLDNRSGQHDYRKRTARPMQKAPQITPADKTTSSPQVPNASRHHGDSGESDQEGQLHAGLGEPPASGVKPDRCRLGDFLTRDEVSLPRPATDVVVWKGGMERRHDLG